MLAVDEPAVGDKTVIDETVVDDAVVDEQPIAKSTHKTVPMVKRIAGISLANHGRTNKLNRGRPRTLSETRAIRLNRSGNRMLDSCRDLISIHLDKSHPPSSRNTAPS